jgi:hypothetical protein
MKAKLLAGIAAAVIISAQAATAQTVGVGVGPVGVGIDFSPEQRTIVREYVKRERPVTFRERVVVGATLPEEVEIRSVPTEWGPAASRYRYVYSDDRVYFVEPSTRRVIQIIE